MTKQGERVLEGKVIQYSRTTILGDMSRFTKNSENLISNYLFVYDPVVMLEILLFGYHGGSHTQVIFITKSHQCENIISGP